MSQKRGTITDQLLNVIQVLQMGRKTGRLFIERGEGATHETGEIQLARGHIVAARSGTIQGQQALSWLHSWGTCRFTFEAGESTQQPTGSHAFPALPGQIDENSPFTRSTSNNGGHEQWNARQSSGRIPALRSPSDKSGFQSSGPLPALSVPQRDSGQFASIQASPSPLVRSPSTCPYRTQPDERGMYIINQTGLSRLHLRLYLLIDGRRTFAELTRLIGRSPEEVQSLLLALAHIDIIKF